MSLQYQTESHVSPYRNGEIFHLDTWPNYISEYRGFNELPHAAEVVSGSCNWLDRYAAFQMMRLPTKQCI